ncbi:MAG: VWA domain-containing protein [Candidatus Aminicenantales bacterium]
MPSPGKSAPQEKVTDQENREVDVRLVLVDVIATKDGEFFPGLKKSEFRLFEDGNEVRINSCDLISMGKSDIRLAEEMNNNQDAPPVIVRKKRLAVLFDGLNSWNRDFKKVAQEVSDELVALAKNDTEVMVLLLDEAKGLRMVQPFTDQEALIREAAAKASGKSFTPFLEFKDYDGILMMGRSLGGDGEGATGDLVAMRAFEHTNRAADKLTRTVGGLLASIHMLESLPGRKNLLFVSSGFPDVDSFKVDNEMPLSRGISIFDPFGILGKKLFWTGFDVLKEIIRVANDRNISIYSLDPEVTSKFTYAGPTAEQFDVAGGGTQRQLFDEKYRQLQNLQLLSEKTGAKLLRGSDKIESFRQVVSNDLSYYYQLSYSPPRRKADKAYHKIEVKLSGRKGVQVKTREGYSDSLAEQSLRIRLAQAFYNPDLFAGKLPFEAGFIPFSTESGKTQPWMRLALPAREFFEGRAAAGEKTYEFHFWIKGDDETGRILTGQVAIPFEMDESFKTRLGSLDFLRLFYVGPGIELGDKANRVIFALFDPETGEIGTWSSDCPLPIQQGTSEPEFVNCVPGYAVSNATDRKEVFLLNSSDGSLECGQIKFFPKTAGGFASDESLHLFFQVHSPGGILGEARFELADQDGQKRTIKGTAVAESWNRTSKIWSAAYKLDFGDAAPGNYVLKIALPSSSGKPELSKEIQLVLGSDQDK